MKVKFLIFLTLLLSVSYLSIRSAFAIENVYILEDNDNTIFLPDDYVIIANAITKFYSTYPDKKEEYDFLSFFSTSPIENGPTYHAELGNDVYGIGRSIYDNHPLFDGSPSKLLGVNFFNRIYDLNSEESMVVGPTVIKNSYLQLIIHETTHQWLMYLGYTRDCSVADSLDCEYTDFKFISDNKAHYSRWANTGFIRDGKQFSDINGGLNGSLIWNDNGDGTLSIVEKQNSFSIANGLSPLSLYLMGLFDPSEVPPLEYVIPDDPNDLISTTVKGILKKITIEDDIIPKYGSRSSVSGINQKDFTMAFVILTKQGYTPSVDELTNVNYIAENFPAQWAYDTFYRSTMNGIVGTPSAPAPSRLIRFLNDPRVYILDGEKIKWIPSPDVFNRLSLDWVNIKTEPSSNFSGYKRVKLWRAEGDTKVYYITEGGLKRHIPNEQTFNSYNNLWEDVVTVKNFELAAIPDNTLIKLGNGFKVYKLENGLKRWVKTLGTFDRMGFRWDQVAPVNSTELDSYPDGLLIE